MSVNYRCDCPITSALDIVGDKWTLVVIKQMLIEGKETFKDFSESDEAIASNILAARLKMLLKQGFISKEDMLGNKKTKLYRLTEKGLSLTPLLVELAVWSDAELRPSHPTMLNEPELAIMREDKQKAVGIIIEAYKERVGDPSVK